MEHKPSRRAVEIWLRGVDVEPAAEAARGRHSGFPGVNVFTGGPGTLAR